MRRVLVFLVLAKLIVMEKTKDVLLMYSYDMGVCQNWHTLF